MRADKLSAYVLYLWLASCVLALIPLILKYSVLDGMLRNDIAEITRSAVAIMIPTTGLAFSRLLVDQTMSRRHVKKHLLPVIFIGVAFAPLAIFIQSIIYVTNGVKAGGTLFGDATLLVPVSTAAMFYVYGVAMKD